MRRGSDRSFHVDGVSRRVQSWSFGNDETFGQADLHPDRPAPDRRAPMARSPRARLHPVARELQRLARQHAGREVHLAGGMHQQREAHDLSGMDEQLVLGDDVRMRDRRTSGICARRPELRELSAPAAAVERTVAHDLVDDVNARVVVVDEEREQTVVAARELAESDRKRTIGQRAVRRLARGAANRLVGEIELVEVVVDVERSVARTTAMGRPTRPAMCSLPSCANVSTVHSVVSTARSSADKADS